MEPARLRVVALIVAAAMFMHNLDSTLIATSLPQIAASFGRPAIDLSIGITAFILATAAFLPISGWLADRFGARDIFIWAVALFTLASIVCAAAGNLALFVSGRVLQGLAGALVAAVGRTLVLRHASGRQLLTAIALITWPGLLAPVIAPVLGGLITTYSTWRWNFLLNLPIGIVVCVLAWRLVPVESRHERRALDLPGLLYSSLAMFGLLYGLDGFAGAHDAANPSPWLWSATGAVALWLMFRHLKNTHAPLLDLAVFRIPTFNLTNGNVAVVFRGTIAATPFLLPLMLQLAYGLSALAAGTYIMIYFLGNLAMKPATSPLLRAFGFRRVLVVNGCISGLATIACGYVSPAQSLWLAAPVLFLAGLARSMQFTCLNTLGFADLAPAQRSSGTTLHTMLQQVSTAVGVAFSALLLQKSAAFSGRDSAALADFHFAFLVAGIAGLISALCYLRLESDAGAEVVS
jgi:EmrB/QacA subfamily drug resistance transporter